MKVRLAREKDSSARLLTFQAEFPETIKCHRCKKGHAKLAFVAHETQQKITDLAVCDILDTTGKKGGLWLHDRCAVAVYFCRDCLNPTALYNQG